MYQGNDNKGNNPFSVMKKSNAIESLNRSQACVWLAAVWVTAFGLESNSLWAAEMEQVNLSGVSATSAAAPVEEAPPGQSAAAEPAPLPAEPVAPPPVRVEVEKYSNFSTYDKQKAERTFDVIEAVLNSKAFRDGVVNHTYQGKKQFVNNDGLSNEQIYERILAAKETYNANADRIVDLQLSIYNPPWYKRKGVIGYGYPGQPMIYINRYYFNLFNAASLAGHIVHEWLHKIGFEHDYNSTARRPYSVPYAVGYLVEDLVVEVSAKSK